MSIPASQAFSLAELVVPTPDGIASRILSKTPGGNVTLFAFDGGQGLTEHTSPYDALVYVVEGHFVLTIGGLPVDVTAGRIVQMPGGVPHAVEALEPSRMLLMMLK